MSATALATALATSLATEAIPVIHKTKSPAFSQFLFEWHEQQQKIYVVLLPGMFQEDIFVPGMIGEAHAQVLAEHCDTHGRFLGFVQTYLRGYRQCEADTLSKKKHKE